PCPPPEPPARGHRGRGRPRDGLDAPLPPGRPRVPEPGPVRPRDRDPAAGLRDPRDRPRPPLGGLDAPRRPRGPPGARRVRPGEPTGRPDPRGGPGPPAGGRRPGAGGPNEPRSPPARLSSPADAAVLGAADILVRYDGRAVLEVSAL